MNQPEKTFNLKFTTEGIGLLNEAFGSMPFGRISGLVADLNQQVQELNQNEERQIQEQAKESRQAKIDELLAAGDARVEAKLKELVEAGHLAPEHAYPAEPKPEGLPEIVEAFVAPQDPTI